MTRLLTQVLATVELSTAWLFTAEGSASSYLAGYELCLLGTVALYWNIDITWWTGSRMAEN